MNFAEGKGPKQAKTPYVLGQFVTLYGNGSASNVNPAPVPYPTSPVISGNVPGSLVPGLVVVSGGTDVGYVCTPDSTTSIQDIECTGAVLTAETAWSGSCVVRLQGTGNRYGGLNVYSSTNWHTLGSVTVTSANVPYVISLAGVSGSLYNAYRLTASGGNGIIDWSLGGMFTDLSAMGVGKNATAANGGIGQMNIANPQNISISGGAIVSEIDGPTPYSNTNADHTYIGQ